MPPKIRYHEEDIVNAAFELARNNGIESLNARSVAAEIGCSTQPIFRAFESMDQLKRSVFDRSVERFSEFVAENRSCSDCTFKSIGLAYLLFAMNEPHLFRLVYLNPEVTECEMLEAFKCKEYVLQSLVNERGFTMEQARLIHQHMWIYTQGLATILAVQHPKYSREELDDMLQKAYHAASLAVSCCQQKKQSPSA